MKKITLFTFLIILSVIMIGCKPKLTKSLVFECENQSLIGTVEMGGQTFEVNNSHELNVISNRLDIYGIANEIVPTGTEGQYEIRLPEDADMEAVRLLITSPGNLEFWKTYKLEEVQNYIPIDSLISYNIDISMLMANYASMGYVDSKDTAKVMAKLNSLKQEGLVPSDLIFMLNIKPNDEVGGKFLLHILRGDGVKKGPALEGGCIVEAKAEPSPWGSPWDVTLKMNAEGTQRWAMITGATIGYQLAMVVDGKVYSAPTVQSKIEGGRSVISGNFSEQEAKELAAILKGGVLPLAVKIISEGNVSSDEK